MVCDPRVFGQPGGHVVVAVGAVVVADDVQLALRVGFGDLLEEARNGRPIPDVVGDVAAMVDRNLPT
jgi:hypothetical protein